MEDFSFGSKPKRAPPQVLFDYFASVSDMSKFVLDQQTVVRTTQKDWLDMAAADRDELLDGAFTVPDIADIPYPQHSWGQSIQEAKDFAEAKRVHEQWQKDMEDLKQQLKKGKPLKGRATMLSLQPTPLRGDFASRAKLVDTAGTPHGRGSISHQATYVNNLVPPPRTPAMPPPTPAQQEPDTSKLMPPSVKQRRPVSELISLMEKKLPLSVKNLEAVTNAQAPSPVAATTDTIATSQRTAFRPRFLTSIDRKVSNTSIISADSVSALSPENIASKKIEEENVGGAQRHTGSLLTPIAKRANNLPASFSPSSPSHCALQTPAPTPLVALRVTASSASMAGTATAPAPISKTIDGVTSACSSTDTPAKDPLAELASLLIGSNSLQDAMMASLSCLD